MKGSVGDVARVEPIQPQRTKAAPLAPGVIVGYTPGFGIHSVASNESPCTRIVRPTQAAGWRASPCAACATVYTRADARHVHGGRVRQRRECQRLWPGQLR